MTEESEVNCTELLAEIYTLLDQESTPEHEAALRKHLDDCPPCLAQYDIYKQLKELLARKCGGEHAPDGLKARLRASIRQTVVQQEVSGRG